MLNYIRNNIIPDMVSSINETIRMGGEDITFGCDNYATAHDEFIYGDETCELTMRIKYSERGGNDPMDEPYSVSVNDISITYSFGEDEGNIQPQDIGVGKEMFEV